MSVPDSDMLILISEVLETPVSTLLGETITEPKADDLKAISEKLEVINFQLAQRKHTKRRAVHWLLISCCAVIVAAFAVLIIINSPYLGWDYSDPETAVFGASFHAFEWPTSYFRKWKLTHFLQAHLKWRASIRSPLNSY